MMKDNFSEQSNLYKTFRPTYPADLYDFILGLVPEKNCAWDCGTGNGQVALELAGHFKKVHALTSANNSLNRLRLIQILIILSNKLKSLLFRLIILI